MPSRHRRRERVLAQEPDTVHDVSADRARGRASRHDVGAWPRDLDPADEQRPRAPNVNGVQPAARGTPGCPIAKGNSPDPPDRTREHERAPSGSVAYVRDRGRASSRSRAAVEGPGSGSDASRAGVHSSEKHSITNDDGEDHPELMPRNGIERVERPARDVRRDHQGLAVDPVDDRAGDRSEQDRWEHPGDHHAGDRVGAARSHPC